MMITAMVERWNKDEERKKKAPYEKCDACAQLRAPGSFHRLRVCVCVYVSMFAAVDS